MSILQVSRNMSGVLKKTRRGLLIGIRLIPNASKDQIIGIEEDATGTPHLKVKVRAVPEKGKANKALENLLAKCLGLPKSSFEVISGHTSRVKTVLITGTHDEIQERFKALTDGD